MNFWRGCAPLLLVSLFATSQSPGAAPEVAQNKESALQEIVVTARKREESLQDVPLSVVAISAKALEQRSIESLEDLAQNVPNFHLSEQPNGGRLAGVAFIRGVGQRDANSAYDPAVGLYVDGVYMGRTFGSNLDLLDVQRVEVLRGPQGTLFGKNTSGGAINIVTQQPDASAGALSGNARLTAGSRDRLDLLGSVNIPLSTDRLAVRLAGSRLMQDGYGHRADGQEMADTDRTFTRAQLLFQPAERFSALLAGDWLELDEKNASFKLIAVNPTGPIAAYNAALDPDFDDRWVSARDYFFSATGPNSVRGRLGGGSLTLAYDGAWGTLKSITAYRKIAVRNELDADGSPVNIVDEFQRLNQHQFSQELQLSGNGLGDRLSWVTGVYYFNEDIEDRNTFPVLTALFGNAASLIRLYDVNNVSKAAFAQATYSLTEQLRLTGGVRYTQDDKDVEATRLSYPTAVQIFAIPDQHNSSATSPRLGLDYRWTDEVMTYLSMAQGAKNGGFNGQAARPTDFDEFDDETVWTYEAGLRSQWLDGRARVNVTAFYSRYKNLQLQINGITNVNGLPTPFNIITNVPRAHISGGEAELMISPARGLTFSGALGLTYGKYTKLPTDPEFVASRVITTDSHFSHVPEVAYNLGAEYLMPVGSALQMTARIDYAHKSRIFYNTENTRPVTQPAYGLLNARLTFDHEPSGISVALFGTNLTDKAYILGGFDDATNRNPGLGFAFAAQGAPREWGISLAKQF
jgi:iron complex outermembrane receptor protein